MVDRRGHLLATLGTCLAVAVAGCGFGPGSHRTFTLATASRDLGTLDLEGMDVHIVATKTGEHRFPCRPTILFPQACTSARITASIEARNAEAPYAYDPGWTGTQSMTVAENEETSEERVDARAIRHLREARLVSCVDPTHRHAAFRVTSASSQEAFLWTLVSVAHGALIGHTGTTDTDPSCEVALREGIAFDARLARDFEAGSIEALTFAATRAVALPEAIDLSLDREVRLDPGRPSQLDLDTALLAALTRALERDATLRDHLIARLVDPVAAFPAGLHVGEPLTRWVGNLVRALPADAQRALFESLAPMCTDAAGLARCPDWRWAAALEASTTLPAAEHCGRAYTIASRLRSAPESEIEDRGLTAFRALAGCPETSVLALQVMNARGHFAASESSYLYPPCLDALRTGTVLDRCRSLPSYALMVSAPRCDAAMLAQAAAAAGASEGRAWHAAALVLLHRCHHDDDARALVARLRELPTWQTDDLVHFLDVAIEAAP